MTNACVFDNMSSFPCFSMHHVLYSVFLAYIGLHFSDIWYNGIFYLPSTRAHTHACTKGRTRYDSYFCTFILHFNGELMNALHRNECKTSK